MRSMARHIDAEPKPRSPAEKWQKPVIQSVGSVFLPKIEATDNPAFFDIVDRRRSLVGDPLPELKLASVLWHSMRYRESGEGRFGMEWTSRTAPSAGGLHPIEILCLPVESDGLAGIYDPSGHAIRQLGHGLMDARAMNAKNLNELTGAISGTTLQLVGDQSKLDACYTEADSLLLRDSGALATIISLVATACDLRSVILGRMGTDVVRAAGIGPPFIGLGAIHVSAQFPS